MPSLVLFRAANVGGHGVFRPAQLAKELAGFGVRSVGAAGSFVVHERVRQATLKAEIAQRVPFTPELVFCSAKDLRDLVAADPMGARAAATGARRFVTFLDGKPRHAPDLPLRMPDEKGWQVEVGEVHGRAVVSVWRQVGKKLLYSNPVVEREFGRSGTTRNWSTVLKLHALLDAR